MIKLLIKQAIDQIRIHPLRSFLAILGTMNGIMAVVMVVAIGQGHRIELKKRIQEVGSNLIVVHPYAFSESDAIPTVIKYSTDDLVHIKNTSLSTDEVAPLLRSAPEVQYQKRSLRLNVIGTDARYAKVMNLHLREGRFLTSFDLERNRHVIVLNETAVNMLGGSHPFTIGASLLVKSTIVSLVGIIRDNIVEFGPRSPVAYIPMTLYKRLINEPSENLLSIYVLVRDSFTLAVGMKEIKSLLTTLHGPNAATTVSPMAEFLEEFRNMVKQALLALVAIASITLLLGGIGLSNLLLSSVQSRTREIGIRKTFGAKDRDIIFQFVIEGLILSLIGGVFGVLLGVIGCVLVLPSMQLPVIIPYSAIFTGVLFSIIVGIVSSYYPAKIAANLQPIDALKYE